MNRTAAHAAVQAAADELARIASRLADPTLSKIEYDTLIRQVGEAGVRLSNALTSIGRGLGAS